QHKEHHDVHDDFVNSHRLYSLLVVIYWRMRRKRLIRPTCAIPKAGSDAASVASGNCTAPLADAA
ncbi:hypothetical protein OH464_23860, partial [Escherichia coli]